MLQLAFPASADDDVLLKVHVRCRSCHLEAYPLAPVNRPPSGISAKRIFKKQKLFERMTFTCAGCGHPAGDMVGLDYAKATDVLVKLEPPVIAKKPAREPGSATLPLAKTVPRRRPFYVERQDTSPDEMHVAAPH